MDAIRDKRKGSRRFLIAGAVLAASLIVGVGCDANGANEYWPKERDRIFSEIEPLVKPTAAALRQISEDAVTMAKSDFSGCQVTRGGDSDLGLDRKTLEKARTTFGDDLIDYRECAVPYYFLNYFQGTYYTGKLFYGIVCVEHDREGEQHCDFELAEPLSDIYPVDSEGSNEEYALPQEPLNEFGCPSSAPYPQSSYPGHCASTPPTW